MPLLLAAGAVLRLAFLGARSLWFDEASTLLLASRPLAQLGAAVVRDEMNTPLFAGIMHFWLKAFADPRIGLRLFSAVCGIGSLLAFRRLARRLLPEPARAPAAFLAAASSYWLHAAQDGRVYALLLLVSILAADAALAAAADPSPRRWAAYAGLGALGLYCHYYFAFALVAHAAWLAWRLRGAPRALRGWVAAHAAIAALFAPWGSSLLAQVRVHARDLAVGEPLTPRHLLDTLGTMLFDPTFLGLALPSWLSPAAGALLAGLAGFGAWRLLARRARPDEARALGFALWGLGAPIVLIAVAERVAGRPVTQARYFYPLSPLAYLAAAQVLSGADRAARAARAGLQAFVAAGACAYFASGLLVDPRLGALAAALARSDRRAPLVYLETYYYLPMRFYYLPERAHYLIAEAAEGMDYAGMPPYDGVVDAARLRALGPCVVMDEKRLLSDRPRWLGTGTQLAELIARSPSPYFRRALARP